MNINAMPPIPGRRQILNSQDVKKRRQSPIGPVLSRFEAKYTIPLDLVDPICDFIAPYCSLDHYSEESPDHFYNVNSLYFDTPSYLFLRERLLRAERRFNVRVRTYGGNLKAPCFLEIKQRIGDIVRKFRAKIFTNDLYSFLHDPTSIDLRKSGGDSKNLENIELFRNTLYRYNAEPVVMVHYKRRAFISECDEYARVTFDRAICSTKKNDYDLLTDAGSMVQCDMQTCFDPGASVVLELKFNTSHVPLWMIDCVRKFELVRRGFSKYAVCMQPIFDRSNSSPWHVQKSSVFRDD